MLINVLRDEQPTHVGVAFDVSRTTFRSDEYADYKANRSKSPDEFNGQVSLIKEVLAALRIAMVEKDGYEADDVIGTLATRARGPVDVVTGDRDLFQLVDDARGVRVLYTARGINDLEYVDEAAVAARYGIPGRSYADFAVLRGDPSDGLPGVTGVGAKTAAALINAFGSLAGIQQAAASTVVPRPPLTAAVLKKLHAATDYLAAAPRVVAVVTDIDLPPVDGELPRRPADPDGLAALAAAHGLESSVRRLGSALDWPAEVVG
jgi:5'-3' exonuclease